MLADFVNWWFDEVNLFSLINDHLIITYICSLVINCMIAGYGNMFQSMGPEELFGFLGMIAFTPFLLALFVMFLPFILLVGSLCFILWGSYLVGKFFGRDNHES